MPLKELVIFHHDQEYLDDVKSLEAYVMAESNVVNIVYTTDEAAVGIKYSASADWPTLGKKLRKDMGKVRAALPQLTSDQCKSFATDGKLNVAGIELVTGDLVITRYVESEEKEGEEKSHESGTDRDVIVILDVRKHDDLEALATLRSLVSRVNKLRKEGGLKATDKVDVFYEYDNGQEDAVKAASVGNEEYLMRAFGAIPQEKSQLGNGRQVIEVEKRAKEADDLDSGERYVLSLVERV